MACDHPVYCEGCGDCIFCHGEDHCYRSHDGRHIPARVGLRWANGPESARTKVFFAGAEVTDRCLSADDRQGWALCWVEDANGAKVASITRAGQLQTELLVGHVTMAVQE